MKFVSVPLFLLGLAATGLGLPLASVSAAPAVNAGGTPAISSAAAPSASPAASPSASPSIARAISPAVAPATILNPPRPPSRSDDDNAVLPAPSSSAQQLYSAAKADLLQIRMLLRNARSQSSVGSGFLIGTSDLVLTNYHVVSQMALDPDVYLGEYVATDGSSGPVALLAVDVLHDLALLRVKRQGTGFFKIPPQVAPLTQGQYLYSLGNPLDLGFAISEGAYNGIIRRSFYEQIMFTGPINAGMSGGPSITADGSVAGVNVSKRRDGELVSFLVPVRYVRELLATGATLQAPPKDFKPIIGQQLLAHQKGMIDHLLETPLTLKTLGPYLVPVRDSDQVRCWGRSNVKAEASFTADTMSCTMESALFVSDSQQTGQVAMSHQYVRSASLDKVRFAALASTLFKVDNLGSDRDSRLTGPRCTEQFVKSHSLPMRAVVCVRAYRKFEGLYNFTLLTASTDDSHASLQSRLDVAGVSYANGLRATRTFLEALGRGSKP